MNEAALQAILQYLAQQYAQQGGSTSTPTNTTQTAGAPSAGQQALGTAENIALGQGARYGISQGYNALTGGSSAASSAAPATPVVDSVTSVSSSASPAASSTLSALAPYLADAGVAGIAGSEGYNWYQNNGGKQILHGGGTGSNYLDSALDSNLITGWANPMLSAIGLGSIGSDLMGNQLTTRQKQENDTQGLLSEDPNNTAWQNYVTGMRTQNQSGPANAADPYDNGKYATWNDYVKGGLDASDLTGAYGNLNTYGPQWASLTPAQQLAVTQGNINAHNYSSNKGEVNIDNQSTADQILQSVLAQSPAAGAAQTGANTNNLVGNLTPAAQAIVAGLSSGGGLNGN